MSDGQPRMNAVLDVPAQRHRLRVDARAARTDATVRSLGGVLLGASLLVVTWLWISGGGIGDFTGWADGLTSIGRWTGLVASDLLLVQVLLMARIPVLERAIG